MKFARQSLSALALVWICSCTSVAWGQFGGPQEGSFGGAGGTSQGLYEAESILIVIPKSRDCVWAFSTNADNADKVELSTPIPAESSPVVLGSNVAVFIHDGSAYGFSAETGKWGSIKLQEPKEPAIPIVGGKFVAIRNADCIYAFGVKQGTWAKATLSEGSQAHPMLGNSMIQVLDGNSLYVFGQASDRWIAIDMANGDRIRVK
ncbi:hypothetical protein [Blastopirellula marina]|nr:hypothetical protein [Blastopirellula marina]